MNQCLFLVDYHFSIMQCTVSRKPTLEILYTCKISDDGMYIHFEDLDTFSKATSCLVADRAMYGKKAPITTVSISVYIVSNLISVFMKIMTLASLSFIENLLAKPEWAMHALNVM